MHEHMLTCMHKWRVFIIVIDHGQTSGYTISNLLNLRVKRAVITASTSGCMYLHVRMCSHMHTLCACWSVCLYFFAYVYGTIHARTYPRMHANMKHFDHHDRASWWHASYVCVFMHMHTCSWLLTVAWRSESAQTSALMYYVVYVHLHTHFMAPTSSQQQSCSYTHQSYLLSVFATFSDYTFSGIPSSYILLGKRTVITTLCPASVTPQL